MIGVVVCLFRCFGRSSPTTDIHLIPCHIVDDGVARDRIATLSDCGLTDKRDNIIDFIQFDNLTLADDVLRFLIGPLSKHGRVATCYRLFQLFTVVIKFDLIRNDSDRALLDRDIATVNPLSAGKVEFNFVCFNQGWLVTVTFQRVYGRRRNH